MNAIREILDFFRLVARNGFFLALSLLILTCLYVMGMELRDWYVEITRQSAVVAGAIDAIIGVAVIATILAIIEKAVIWLDGGDG